EQQEDENDGQLIIDEENLSSQLAKLNGTIKCQFPNKNLHNFIGQLRSSIDSVSLSIVEIGLGEQELLLKGSSLRSTAYSLGCVVYTGKESKVCLNQQKSHDKFSTLERRMNFAVLAQFIVLVSLLLFSAINSYLINV
ncbi:MAG: hypothetical protein EZS28_053617, partial [Streblomastix strix]